MKTRDEQINDIARRIALGGWSSIRAYVEDHIQDWELEDDDEINTEED